MKIWHGSFVRKFKQYERKETKTLLKIEEIVRKVK